MSEKDLTFEDMLHAAYCHMNGEDSRSPSGHTDLDDVKAYIAAREKAARVAVYDEVLIEVAAIAFSYGGMIPAHVLTERIKGRIDR